MKVSNEFPRFLDISIQSSIPVNSVNRMFSDDSDVQNRTLNPVRFSILNFWCYSQLLGHTLCIGRSRCSSYLEFNFRVTENGPRLHFRSSWLSSKTRHPRKSLFWIWAADITRCIKPAISVLSQYSCYSL